MRWIKAGRRPTLPINPPSHLGTYVTGAGNGAGAPTPCRRLLHTSGRIRSDERRVLSRRIGHSRPYGTAAAAELCRTPARGDLVGHSMCRFPEAGIPLPIVDAVCPGRHEGYRVRHRRSRAVARSAEGRRAGGPRSDQDIHERSARPSAQSAGPPSPSPPDRIPPLRSAVVGRGADRARLDGVATRVTADSALCKGSWQTRLNAPRIGCVLMANQAPLYGAAEPPAARPRPPGGRVF